MDELSPKDFNTYMAYDRIDPFGSKRDDISAAIICQTLAAVQGIKTNIDQFIPTFDEADVPKKKRKTADRMLMMMTARTKEVGGEIK